MTEFVEMPMLPASDASNGGRFSYAVAGSVRSAFELAASRLEEQSSSRVTYVSRELDCSSSLEAANSNADLTDPATA